jgi:phage-related minor tail protein
MASKRIRGITIEIGGNTTKLQDALKDVDKRTSSLSGELKDVERLLKLDPSNVEALAQKQKILTESVEATTDRLDALKKAQSEVQKQFERGNITEKQYRDFRREIEFTEGSLKNLKNQLKKVNDGSALKEVKKDAEKAKDSIKDLGGEISGVIGGLAAGAGIGGTIQESLDLAELETKIDITFEVPESSKKIVKEAVKGIQAYGVDAEEALEGVRRQWALNKNSSDEANRAIVDGAAVIANAYTGIDFTELIQETNEISSELNMSNENALGLVNSLLKMGFPPEQLDIIAEYGKQLHDAGYNASEIQAIFEAGVETGTWNIDNLLDGIKEGRIRMAEFAFMVPEAISDILDGTDLSAKQFMEWGKAVAEGGEGGSKAMEEMTAALMGMEDDTKRTALGAQIFGTIWEDQGANVADTILNAKDKVVDLKANQDELNASVEKMDSNPAVELNIAMADMKEELAPLLTAIATLVGDMARWASENPTLTASIVAITTALGILIGIFMALTPIIVTLTGLAGALGISVGAVASPVLIVIGVITALIAIGVLLYKNWDIVKAKASELSERFPWLKTAIGLLTNPIGTLIGLGKKLYDNWDVIREKAGKLREKIAGLFDGIKWELPKIKLPHFKVKGSLDLNPMGGVSVPKVSVDWYKNGGRFLPNSPQIIGIGDHPTAEELALPLTDEVFSKIAKGINQFTGGGSGITVQNMIVREEADILKIARELYKLQKSGARKAGVVF